MPCWRTHLRFSTILNESLHFEGREREQFLFGSIAPDLNNGYIVDTAYKASHAVTHFAGKEHWTEKLFYKEYQQEIKAKNPFCLGVFFHIYIDMVFNENFYSEILAPKSEEKIANDEYRIKKQKDFAVFGRLSKDYDLHFAFPEETLEVAKTVKEYKFSKKDLAGVEKYFDDIKKYEQGNPDYKYNYYNDDYLEKLAHSAVESFRRLYCA